MKTIVIWQHSNSKIGSRLIRWATGEKYSHIGVQLNTDGIYHSDVKGCHITSIEEFSKKCNYEYTTKDVSDEEYEDMLSRANSRLGDPYDFLGALGLGLLVILARRLFVKIKIPVLNPKWLFCSEYSEYIIWGTQTELTPGQVAEKATQS
jgi:hypothetical protein